ncbi:MAG: 16S rRNA (guanine(966)-N(2))-methyltransferase RsmD [Actinocatenispora sp.]
MTRVVAGELGGRRLVVPAGRATRPTSDRVREALFSSLDAIMDLPGARVADLYAGSGALGFEALSRGAAHALFVESDARAVTALRRNIATLGVAGAARLSAAPVERVLAEPPADGYDLVLLDPPYALADDKLAVVLAALPGWLIADALVVVERATRSGEPPWAPDLDPIRSRRYGETTLWYGRRS